MCRRPVSLRDDLLDSKGSGRGAFWKALMETMHAREMTMCEVKTGPPGPDHPRRNRPYEDRLLRRLHRLAGVLEALRAEMQSDRPNLAACLTGVFYLCEHM